MSVARGEQEYFDESGIPTATEACKSNALMRCCKDLGIASELWDPTFIRDFKSKHCVEVWVEHAKQKTKSVTSYLSSDQADGQAKIVQEEGCSQIRLSIQGDWSSMMRF